MHFKELAEYFEKIEAVSSRIKMIDLLAEMLKKPGSEEIDKVIYLSQGKLGPQFEEEEIGLGEKLVEEALAKVSGYTKKEIDALFKKKGDLGVVAEELISKKKQRSLAQEELSIKMVFDSLMKIATSEGKGSQELKLKLLAKILNSASQAEAKYIVRVPIGKLRLGIGDPTIMDALASIHLGEFKKANKKLVEELNKKYKEEDELERRIRDKLREQIEEKYNIKPDLGEIAKTLKKSGLKGLREIGIEAGTPIRPTLAERLPSAEEIIKKLGKCAVEAKYDGFRFQVHKSGNKVTIFSRRQEDMTSMFPEIVEGIRKQVKAEHAIIEGEALAFNEETQQYLPFQVTMQRKRKYDIEKMAKEFPLKLFVFDIMFVNGKNIMDLPFRERRKKLESTIKKGQVIELTESIITDDPAKINEFFNSCVERGLEGIIAKDLNAKYIAGARKFAWIKLKRSYKGELSDTIDTVIIGYFKGKGHRTQFGLGALLTAVYDKKDDKFRSIAKIGTGMTEEQMVELHKMLSKIKEEKKPARVDSELEPDVWVSPKYVIEVIADEITKSPVHTAAKENGKEGLALRFPRMVKLRSDRKPDEATTVEEITKMFKAQKHVKVSE